MRGECVCTSLMVTYATDTLEKEEYFRRVLGQRGERREREKSERLKYRLMGERERERKRERKGRERERERERESTQ